MLFRPIPFMGIAFFASSCFAAANAQTLISQANNSPRIRLANEIQTVAFEFGKNPGDYSLVEKTEDLSWKMIRMSEGLSSCALPIYDLPWRLESLNTQYVMSMNSLQQMGNVPESAKDQIRVQMEQSLNGSKANIAKVLKNVMKYCR